MSSSIPGPSATMFNEATRVNIHGGSVINCGGNATVNVHNNNSRRVAVPDVIGFIKNTARQFVARTRRANGKERDPVKVSNLMAQDPNPSPVLSIADRYTRSMLYCMVGYPLYEPEPFSKSPPEYLRRGVDVGDVGFIREDGTFDFLFNICPAQNSSVTPPKLPDGFTLSEDSGTRSLRPFEPETRFFPSTVKEPQSNVYTCKGPDGAVLVLPKGAIQEEAINNEPFEQLAKRHGVEWYKYTKAQGRSISNGSLYLVTSFTKCTQWGIAVFDRPSDPGQAVIFTSSPPRWEGLGALITKVAYPSQEDASNQCVFLRGYKIMIRPDIFNKLPAPATRIRGGGGTDLLSKINSLARKKTSTAKKPKKPDTPADDKKPPVHPLDLINVELLSQNPDAKIALTHDDVWCDLLHGTMNDMKLDNIAQSYTSVVDEYGCVSLEKISGASVDHPPIKGDEMTADSIGETSEMPPIASILWEFLQHSNDAGATKQIFVLDKDNPALIGYNDSGFLEPDRKAVQSIRQSSKKADTSKNSKYIVGFKALCCHLTDQIQILSDSFFTILDPLNSNDTKIGYDEFKRTEHYKHFDFFSNDFKPNSFHGTATRLPLRSSRNNLGQRIVHIDEVQQMISDYIAEELDTSLLFLDKVKTIEIWETGNGTQLRLATWTKSGTPCLRPDPSLSVITYDSTLSDGNTGYLWRIVQTRSPENEAVTRLSQWAGSDSVTHVIQRHKLRPEVCIAYPLTTKERMSGRLFTYSPLPSRTDFPVHVHALFALTPSRQILHKPNEGSIVQDSEDDILIKWNQLLFNHYIPQCWSYLLKSLVEDPSCGDILDAWPPNCSCITWRDGVYWQDILSDTFKIVVESGLKVWPKLAGQGQITYIDLKSSLIVARGQVDAGVLAVLAELGLMLVQLPQSMSDVVNDSMVKLSPSIAHERLQGLGAYRFDQLSVEKRALVCDYLLSDNDISNIFGLPLIPVLNGSLIALDIRSKSLRHFEALTMDEATVFRTPQRSPHVILLDQLSPKLTGLIREQGIIHTNVAVLDPRGVIRYLSSGHCFSNDEELIKFWCWLCEWHSKIKLLSLIKENYPDLQLIPTTQGPRSVIFPIFNTPHELGNVQLFESLGLAFVTSALPASVIHFLHNHNILRNVNNLNHLLAAIDPASVPSLTDEEAQSILRHVTSYYGTISTDNLERFRKLPIFPLLAPTSASRLSPDSNSSVSWRRIDGINVKGISPIQLIPLGGDMRYLDGPSIGNSSCPVLKQLDIPVLKEDDILLHALSRFSPQPKPLQAAFISYIKNNQDHLPIVILTLRKTNFLRTTDNSLQSPQKVIDPNSSLASLFTHGCKDSRVPVHDGALDQQLFHDLRTLALMKTELDAYLVQERISYISSNSNAPEAQAIARSLVALMSGPSFPCDDLFIDPNMHWLPTASGLLTSKQCINSDRRDTDLFDKVLFTLDRSISVSPSFKSLLDWDKPLPLDVLTQQFRHTLDSPESKVQNQKICSIIRELADRQLRDTDIQDILTSIGRRPWVPTKSRKLALPSRAVFANVDITSGFHEVVFSRTEKRVHLFLCRIGCLDKPTATAIIEELEGLQEQCQTDGTITVVQRAILLLKMLPDSMTEEEYQSVLVPDESGCLVPLISGVCYHNGLGGGITDVNERETGVAHHLVTEALAKKLKMKGLGIKGENITDPRGNPIPIIRNILNLYDPMQFFIEFIANASNAKAKQFSLLVDDHKGPTGKVISNGIKVFQSASLVVYNDGVVFTPDDFSWIQMMGIGSKKGNPNIIGYYGLGALSMFHFTELPMIISGSRVMFLNPSIQSLGYKGRNSALFSIQDVKRIIPDHFEPLDGLFGFDSNSTDYQGTIFRLPLRVQAHLTNVNDPVSTRCWPIKEIENMLLKQFDDLGYKSLLFTGLGRIDLLVRRGSELKTLRSIQATRLSGKYEPGEPFKSEITTFKTTNTEMKWFVLSQLIPMPKGFEKVLEKSHRKAHVLQIQVAAALEGAQVFGADWNLFRIMPLSGVTSLPVHISAPFVLGKGRRNIRLDIMGVESEFNRWLLSSEIPRLYLYLLEVLLKKQGSNTGWWPPTRFERNTNDIMASQAIVDAFWSPEILGASSGQVFIDRKKSRLAPKDVTVLIKKQKFFSTIKKILEVSNAMDIVEFSGELWEDVNYAGLRIVDPPFVKTLLEDPQVCQQLNCEDKRAALLFLCTSKTSLHKLPLLPLEDGSFATILLQGYSEQLYYIAQQVPGMAYPPFRKNRLISRHLEPFLSKYGPANIWESLLRNYNVSLLSGDGIVELIEECINPVDELIGDQDHRVWVDDFWNAQLEIPQAVSFFPLVPTHKPLHYISLQKVTDPSVIILEEAPSEQQSHYKVLQSLGLIVVVRPALPSNLQKVLPPKRLGTYATFLDYIKENPEKLGMLRRLQADEQGHLGLWIRANFSNTPNDLADVACKLPVWPVQQAGKVSWLAALNDDDIVILPPSLPTNLVTLFTDCPFVDWEDCMKNANKGPCTGQDIIGLLHISANSLLRSSEQVAYKEFVTCFMMIDKISDERLLVPNNKSVLKRVNDLYEHDDPFITIFNVDFPFLLSQDFQDLAQDLERYGLKRQCRFDLSMFIECAQAFDSECNVDNQAGGIVLYQSFNTLQLSSLDSERFSELDHLKFIPCADARRPGYDDINTPEYMAVPQSLLAPSQITIPEFEAVCWSQKGRANPPLNATLCNTYQTLGRPDGADVVAHLAVLAEIAQKHGRRRGLLSDLCATYGWLNDHADGIASLLSQQKREILFLNVDDPESDDWTWHSSSNLVIDLRDFYDLHGVKSFLRNYDKLLRVAGVRKIKKRTAEVISTTDKTFHQMRDRFNEMRQSGFSTDVNFEAQDTQYSILPAHKTWLVASNNHFTTTFVASGMKESRTLESNEPIKVERSSLCVREVINWFYVGKLPDFLVSSNNDEEETKGRLELGLEMLSLADEWEVTDLHEQLQVFIINDPDFINPYWVRRIQQHAEATMATHLVEYCQRYEEENRSIIDDCPHENLEDDVTSVEDRDTSSI